MYARPEQIAAARADVPVPMKELVAVEIRLVLDEVVGVSLTSNVEPRVWLLNLNGPRTHDVGLEIVWILVEVLLRKNDVPRRGQVAQE